MHLKSSKPWATLSMKSPSWVSPKLRVNFPVPFHFPSCHLPSYLNLKKNNWKIHKSSNLRRPWYLWFPFFKLNLSTFPCIMAPVSQYIFRIKNNNVLFIGSKKSIITVSIPTYSRDHLADRPLCRFRSFFLSRRASDLEKISPLTEKISQKKSSRGENGS